MNVLALNGSPRLARSSTYHMLKPLLEGMQAAGATTQVLHVHALHLKPCLGCFKCWTDTPGVCAQKDGMAEALEKYAWADLLIFGTPLYFSLMTGQLKTFIDRLLPLSEPSLVARSNAPGLTGHPSRLGAKTWKALLVSPCGFPETENFDALIYTFKFLAPLNNWTYLGEILRPGAEPLAQPELQPFFARYYTLLRQAGEQLIREDRISEALQAELRQDLFPVGREQFAAMANSFWQMKASAPGSAKAQTEAPDSGAAAANGGSSGLEGATLREQMARMPARFRPEAAAGFQGDIQFDFGGAEAGQYYLHFDAGGCSFQDGSSAAPVLTMHISSEDWRAMGRGDLAAPEAFMSGKLKADGDFGLMMKWRSFFAAA
jgi:putative sterol carrier protein